MKLISMTDFVLEKWNEDLYLDEYTKVTHNYAKFLKQPLKLEMFVPCDEDGNVLEQPCDVMNTDGCRDCACRVYKKAKEKVLFESFMVLENEPLKYVTIGFNNIILTWSYKDNDFLLNNGRTIERFIKSDLTLTLNAIKQLGL